MANVQYVNIIIIFWGCIWLQLKSCAGPVGPKTKNSVGFLRKNDCKFKVYDRIGSWFTKANPTGAQRQGNGIPSKVGTTQGKSAVYF